MRRIAVMIRSRSDLPQCQNGWEYLKKQVSLGNVVVVEVIIASLHWNTDDVLNICRRLPDLVDVVIVGAGWANHLTGTFDAYLRNTLKNDKLVVVGQAFADPQNPIHTQAARLSITEVPRTQVVFKNFDGPDGFLRACIYAVEGQLPSIKLPDSNNPKLVERFTLDEAIVQTKIELIKQQKKGKWSWHIFRIQ